ncbi:MAG: hypothetical protein V4795_22460 [Pseudomonadota bacterium]
MKKLRHTSFLPVIAAALASPAFAQTPEACGKSEFAFLSSVHIQGVLIRENQLEKGQLQHARDLACRLVADIDQHLLERSDKNKFSSYSAPNPAGGIFAAAAVLPAKGLPPDTPIPICISKNNVATSAWRLTNTRPAALMPADLTQNSAEQSHRPACYATLVAAKKTLDDMLAQRQASSGGSAPDTATKK